MKQRTTLFLKIALFVISAVILALSLFWLPTLAREAAAMNPE